MPPASGIFFYVSDTDLQTLPNLVTSGCPEFAELTEEAAMVDTSKIFH